MRFDKTILTLTFAATSLLIAGGCDNSGTAPATDTPATDTPAGGDLGSATDAPPTDGGTEDGDATGGNAPDVEISLPGLDVNLDTSDTSPDVDVNVTDPADPDQP